MDNQIVIKDLKLENTAKSIKTLLVAGSTLSNYYSRKLFNKNWEGLVMIKLLKEFKDFAVKGNVMDMAVGVIIGGAFSKIITSLVSDIVMPALSVVTNRVDIKSLAVTIASADETSEPIQIAYGLFLQNIIDFLIIAFCIFFTVKMLNKFKRKQDDSPAPAPSPEQELLTEIRDILKAQQ